MEAQAQGAEIGSRGWRPHLLRTVLLVALLVPVAHCLAIAHEWLYFPPLEIERFLREHPLRGFYRVPLLRGTVVFLVELLAAGALVAWLRRRLGVPWMRAVGDGALHLLPLSLAPLTLFQDHVPSRLMLFAAVIAGTTALVVFRALPASLGPAPDAPSRWPRRLAPALVGLAATYFMTLALLRHGSYWSSIIDLGLFSGALRSTLHGPGFLYAPEIGVTFMAEHFSPILVLLAPLYRLFPDPATLLVFQSLAVAAGAWLLFLFAEETLGDGWLALALCASYLLAPDMFESQWHDFHMDLLMPPMIFGALLALRRDKVRWFLFCVALLWATKEDAFVYTALLGLYAWLAHRRRALGIGLAAASVVFGVVLLQWVLPAYRMFQEHGWFFNTTPGVRGGYKFAERYAHLGRSLWEVVKNAAANPVYVVGHVTSDDRFGSLLALTAPLGFAALLGGLPALLLLAASLVMLLASNVLMTSFSFYYGAIPLAFGYAAGVVGLARAGAWLAARDRAAGTAWAPRFRTAATAYVCAAALLLAWVHPESNFSPAYARPRYLTTAHTRLLDEVVASIPPDVPVAATGYVGVHLMNRPRPRMLPFGMERAQWIVIDLYRPPWPVGGDELWRLAERLARDPQWGVVRAERGVLVYRRGAERSKTDQALEMMRSPIFEAEEWETSLYPNLAEEMDGASGGYALVVTPADRRGPGHLFYGPYMTLPPGEYEAEFRLAVADEPGRAADTKVATLDVFRDGEVLARRDLAFRDFVGRRRLQTFTLRFRRTEAAAYEFRVFYHDAGTVALDAIRLRRVNE